MTPPPISADERRLRLDRLRDLMRARGVGAVLLGPSSSLRYFTGIVWGLSERFTGALILPDRIEYVCPAFEREKVTGLQTLAGEIRTWEEEEDPFALIARAAGAATTIALDPYLPFFMYRRLRAVHDDRRLVEAEPLTTALRSRKSEAEIALMRRAKAATLEVHRRARDFLEEGVLASEVARFIDAEHRALAGAGSTFCIVSFGEDTALPHGGETDRRLRKNDPVLIDTGTEIDGYKSDITRTYVFGAPTAEFAAVWEAEKRAQAAAFAAARPGAPCSSVDDAARASLAASGFGPNYLLPGLPHRTGHGIGLDVHEAPNLVRGDATPLERGMCFSNEPMIVLPGR
ncbi:MAG: Xaa-Pro peptidase family protein, partial [Parvularculaceae bacterium]|nr:Xaa-Pro peptidase family protein [Parvularculaceae bacterium]